MSPFLTQGTNSGLVLLCRLQSVAAFSNMLLMRFRSILRKHGCPQIQSNHLESQSNKMSPSGKKPPQYDSDIRCESLHFVFLLPSIRMHFLFSHLALPSAHTPALHIPSSSPAANADGSSQQQATAEGDVIHVFPPRAIKRAPAGTRVVQ